jgi:hypothetical protein
MSGADAFLRATRMAKRVDAWERRMAPVLAAEEAREERAARPAELEAALLRAAAGLSRSGGPADFCALLAATRTPAPDVARAFLATLQLANNGNVDIGGLQFEGGGGGSGDGDGAAPASQEAPFSADEGSLAASAAGGARVAAARAAALAKRGGAAAAATPPPPQAVARTFSVTVLNDVPRHEATAEEGGAGLGAIGALMGATSAAPGLGAAKKERKAGAKAAASPRPERGGGGAAAAAPAAPGPDALRSPLLKRAKSTQGAGLTERARANEVVAPAPAGGKVAPPPAAGRPPLAAGAKVRR